MPNPEQSPQPAPEEHSNRAAVQLRNQLNSDPYRFTAFKEYLKNKDKEEDTRHSQDLEVLMRAPESITGEVCNTLTAYFNEFMTTTKQNGHPEASTVMGRQVHPDVAQTMEDGWHTALTQWNNRHSK